jgi:late competence protein required for DNA uptake (superfamily II DNA/RNA helicase)
MATVQLRRYQVKPGEMDDFVKWWQGVLSARQQYGFDVLFALVDESTNQFVWAVSYEGDSEEFDAAEKTYLASPERADVFAGVPSRIDQTFVSKVNVIHQIWPAT